MSTKTLWTKARRYVLASSLGLLLPLGLNGCQTALEFAADQERAIAW